MEFSIACSEVFYILTNLKQSELKKIPQKLIELICILKIDEYSPTIDVNKPLEEQNLTQDTKELISLIYNKYLGSKEEKENYEKEYNSYIQKEQKINNFEFKKNTKKEEPKALIEYKPKTNIFLKIIEKIKSFLK